VRVKSPDALIENLKRAFDLLSKRDKGKYFIVVTAQVFTALLDIIGVLLFGLIGLLGTSLTNNAPMPSFVDDALTALGIASISTSTLISGLAGIAAAMLLLKSFFSALLMRKVFNFLGSRQADISSGFTSQLFSEPISAIQQRSSQEYSYALSQGIFAAVTLTLGSLSLLASELALLAFLSMALFVISPQVTAASVIFFALVGLILQKSLGSWATNVGKEISTNSVESHARIQEIISSYRELSVLGRRSVFVSRLDELWKKSGTARADQIFIESLPKIAYETALVIGGLGLAIWQFSSTTPEKAVSVIVLFIVAGSRVLPSMLRLNSLILHTRSGLAQANLVFLIADELERSTVLPFPNLEMKRLIESRDEDFPDFLPTIRIKGAFVSYPTAPSPSLFDINLQIKSGSRVAIAGSSGAGKSTLADAILGIIQLTSGEILVSGEKPSEAVLKWPGAISYVPQSVALLNGTIRENIALGIDPIYHSDDELMSAIVRARLGELVESSIDGLDTWVGENGVQLSGGQRQRLGLARAFYAKSKLYVFDEATSSLDAETEMLVSEAIQELGSNITTITIAHRLSTIKDSEHIVYLESGRVAAQGNFHQVCSQNATFRLQAEISGLI
jgi:ABC-type multidrug transport system fused ATPase/permease subunit